MPMLRIYDRFIRLNLAMHTIDDEDLLQERKIADLFSRATKELRDVHQDDKMEVVPRYKAQLGYSISFSKSARPVRCEIRWSMLCSALIHHNP